MAPDALARHYATLGGAGAYLIIALPLLTIAEWMATYSHTAVAG